MKKSSACSEILHALFGSLGSLGSSGKAKRDVARKMAAKRRRDYLGPTKKKKMKNSNTHLERRSRNSSSSVDKHSSVTSDDGASWVRSRFLGQGGFGTVYLAVTDNGKEMAVKSAEMSHASTLMDETRILQGLSSPYVVSCLGDDITTETETGEQYYNIMLEYCSGQSLTEFIRLYKDGLQERKVKMLATDILNGLSHIHCRQIIHCDIKPDNILLVPRVKWLRPDWFVAKIADFGLALEKDSVEYHEQNGYPRGTTMYMSPELAAAGVLDYAVDIWAFGCTVLEMLTGKHAWGKDAFLDREELMDLIAYADEIPVIPDFVSDEARDFLEKCLVIDASKRWTTDALLAHPFLFRRSQNTGNGLNDQLHRPRRDALGGIIAGSCRHGCLCRIFRSNYFSHAATSTSKTPQGREGSLVL